MPHRLSRLRQLMLVLAVVFVLPSCGKPAPIDTDRDPKISTNKRPSNGSALQPIKQPNQPADILSWQDAAREDPDPRVRLHAIETWSQKPGDTLDPVTHAMVDPDETVRARAQQLFEEALARK
jgi:hypothetical protein